MKKSLLVYLCLIIFSSAPVSAQYFEVYVHQNRQPVTLQNNIAYLESVPFEIVVYMSNPMAVMVSASLSSQSYDLAMQNAPLSQIPDLCAGCGNADYSFNPKKNLYLPGESHNMWYYESSKAHSFDDIAPYSEGGFHAYRRIELITTELEEDFNVREMGPKMVYLVFALTEWDQANNVSREIGRQSMVLAFR